MDLGVPEPIAKVKTVADLRSLLVWPEGLALVVRRETDRRLSYVGVERRSWLMPPPQRSKLPAGVTLFPSARRAPPVTRARC